MRSAAAQLHITGNFTLVNAQEPNVGVGAKLLSPSFGSLAVEFFQQSRRGTEEYGVAGEHDGVADILRDHGLPNPFRPTRTRLRAGRKSRVRARSTMSRSILVVPVPFVIGHGFEALDSGDS